MLYKNLDVNEAGHLMFAGFDTTVLAERYGTPLMLMDEAVIRARCREYKTAMARNLPAGSRPLYASKSLSIKRIYEIMAEEEMGIDVVSAGTGEMKKRYGFVYVDMDDLGNGTLQRSRKDSFYYYKKVIASDGEDLD